MASDSDVTAELALIIGAGIAAGAVNRQQVFDTAMAVLGGPARHAERFGQLIAAATIDALRQGPKTPAQQAWDAMTGGGQ